MPGYRYKPKVSRQVVVDRHGGILGREVDRLQREGYVKFIINKEYGRDKWEIEATKFIKEEM